MQSSQVRNVGLPSCADTKRDVPAWTQDPKIFPLDWFSISRPNIIRQTKEYVSELSKWRNCPKIKTLSKLKAVLKRIMMFLRTHISYIDGKSLLECDLEEDLITLVSLYMDMELRVLLIKKSATSGATTSIGPGPAPGNDTDSARNDKLVSDRISYWLYTVLTGHEQRVDALLSTTVYTRHTRPVLDPIFRKVLSEMPDGPFSNVSYVRNMLAYKTWRERTLVSDDVVSEELNARVLQQLVPHDYAFPSTLLRCLGKGENARDHARPHNVNLADACRNFMRYCRDIPATAAEQINFESIPLLDDEMLGDEENEVNNLMNMISSRKQRKTGSASPRNSIQVDAFIDLTLPKSKTKSASSRTNPSASVAAVIDLTEEDEKPVITAPTSVVVEPAAAPSRVAPAVQRINTSKKPQTPQECSYALTPSAPQVETRCFTAYRDQDIYLVNISCMCPVRAHRQRECQCQDKKSGYYKENKALKTSITERKYEKDATFVGRCFQFSIGNQYAYPSEDDVDTELEPLVVGNSQDQVKLEMRSSTAVTCNTNEDKTQDETTEFCDKLFSAGLNLCDCDGCKKRDTNLSRYENRTCASDKTCDESANELSDNAQCRQKPLVTCTQRVTHPTSVADMYAMEKASPIVLQSQQSATLSGNESNLEHFSETLDKRKAQYNKIQNTKISKDNFVQNTDNLSSNCLNEIRKIKLPVIDKIIEDTPDKCEQPVLNEDCNINSNDMPTDTFEETVEKCRQIEIPPRSEDNFNVIPINYEETEEHNKILIPHSTEETSNSTILTNTYEDTEECRKVEIPCTSADISNNAIPTSEETTECLIPQSSEEDTNGTVSTNTYEETTECETIVIPHSSEEHSTPPTNTFEETTECEKEVISEIVSHTFPSNTFEETTECEKEVISEIVSHTFPSNTYEETTECENEITFHSSEENSNVMPSNNDEEKSECSEVISDHSEKDPAQSTNIATVFSNETNEHQNTLVADIEVHTESTNIIAETPSFDISIFQEQISFVQNAQHVPSLPKSNSEIEIEKLCNEITELGSAIPDNDIPVAKDSNIVTNEEFLQTDYVEEITVSEPSVTISDPTNIARNLEEIPENIEQTTLEVSIPNIETTVEEIIENNYESCAQPIQSDSSAELKDLENIEETSNTAEESATKEELPTEKNLLEIKPVLPDHTKSVIPVEENLVQQLSPETEIVIESEIVVESIPEIPDITTQTSSDNQLEIAELNDSNAEPAIDETNTITQDLHEIVTETVNAESKEKESFVCDLQKNEFSESSKNDEENLSPRKRRRRMPDLNVNVVIDEDNHKEQCEVTFNDESKIENLTDDTSDNIEDRKCVSVDESINADNLPEQPKLIKSTTNVLEETPDITNSTCQENDSNITSLPISSEEIVSNDTIPSDLITQQEIVTKDTVTLHTSEVERPKRRRKQNLKNIREEKLTSSVDIVEDKLTVPQKQNKELVPVCKNLSQNEIENLRKNKSLLSLENNSKLILTEAQDTVKIQTNMTNQVNEDISTTNLKIVEKLPQPAILNDTKNEKIEADSNAENNNANIENSECTLQPHTKEKQKQRTVKLKRRKKSQLVDNKEIQNNVEDQVINSTFKLVETLPNTKVKRPRGRPSKVASTKLKFFSENLNLQNLDTGTKNNTELCTALDQLNTPANELSDEDVPLANRVSQSIPQKRNSLKSSNKILNKIRLSDTENELVNSEDELPLTARKQKIKLTKHPKNYSNSAESIIKPKSIREKLERFKFQARDKTDTNKKTQLLQDKESEIFTQQKFNTENKSKKYVKTYSNTRALKTPKLFSVPEIIQTSTVKPSKSNIATSPVKPKKSLRFSSEVTTINYEEYSDDSFSSIPETTKNVNKSKELFSDSDTKGSKNLNASLHRAEQIKIKKFREISNKTDLLPYENQKITEIKDIISPEEKYSDLKSSNNKEIKTKPNLNLTTKKMLSKKARAKLFPEVDEINKEKDSKFINNTKVEEATFPENIPLLEEKIENTLLPDTSILECKGIESSIKIRKNEEEIVNIEQKENSLTSPIELKIDTQISSKDEDNNSEIKVKCVPKKRKSKFPKLKLNLRKKNNSCSPKKLQNNIDSPPKGITRFKKINKIQSRLNGSNKTKKVITKRKHNKIEANVNVLQQDLTSKLKCEDECKDILPDSNKDSEKYTSQTKENQNVQVTENICNTDSTLSSENIIMESDEITNISLKKVEEKAKNFPEEIESANISGDMLYKPSNKIYEKNFEFYSDQDDASNSELVIDTSAESSDAEDVRMENKLKGDKINQQIQSKIPDLQQTKYHHSIAEIVNISPVENTTLNKLEDNSYNTTQDCINTVSDDIEQIVVYQSKNDENLQEDLRESDKIDDKNNKIEDIELTILFRESPKEHSKENSLNNEICDPLSISVSEETIVQESNSEEQQKHVIVNPPTSDEIITENNEFQESMEQTVSSQETCIKHQQNDVCDSSSISIVEETVVEEMVVDESHFTNKDHNNTVLENNTNIQSTVDEKPNECVNQNKIVVEEHTAEITEISEEIYDEFNIEKIIEEKAQQLNEPFGPSVEMFINIEVGFESCIFSQNEPLQGEHAKESCAKCSVNGKHKNNKKVKVQGIHQYEEHIIEECLEENAVLPDIPYCKAVETFEPNLCICTAKDETVEILTNNSPVIVDNYNLYILADIANAMSSIHTKTENNNVIEIAAASSNDIQNQGPLQKDERCIFVTYPENVPTSSKPGTDISVVNSSNEEISVNVQKLAGGLNSKGTLLENKIQVLTERAKNGNKINGENLDELYKSLENICELEINTLTKSSPKSDCQNNIAAVPVPIETFPVNPKIHEPNNITIDIPNTALLHLTPDDDEPFSLPLPVVQSLETIETPAEPKIENKPKIDTTVVKNLYNVLDSITIDKETSNNENENCDSPKEAEQVIKTKSKKGKSKSKSSNNQNSEASYLLNKYKSNQDSNKNTDTNNQQNSSSKNNNSSPPSYIRSTRPMRMVTTRKRNINVLDNNCPPDEPAKKISASEKMFDKLLEEHKKELSEAKIQNTKEETIVNKNVENVHTVSDTTMPVLDDISETVISAPIIDADESNIPLPVLHYEKCESNLKSEEIEPPKLDTSNNTTEKLETDTSVNDCENASAEKLETGTSVNNCKGVNEEKLSEEKIVEETPLEMLLENEKDLACEETQSEDADLTKQAEKSEEITNTCTEKQVENNTEEITNTCTEKQVEKNTEEITNTCTEKLVEKNTEEQIDEEEIDRNTTAIEVVQDWFNRVDDNKAQSESYTDITSIQTIEECNFFEEISSTSENSPNARKTDEKVFSEHQTPDSGIAFDEDSVQKDKSVPENLSDGETYSPTEPAVTKSYFCNLDQSGSVQQIEISDLKIVKPESCEINNVELKVSIALERIKEILPLLTKYKISSPERKFKKRKEHITESDKAKKRKYSLDETHVNVISEECSNNTLIKDYKFKRRKHLNDDNILQECVIEDVMSPATSQRDISIRTKGSVKEYPDCLFGITESPVPSGSFHSPYPSDISITEEPTFYEEGGIDLCNDYPCYDSFEVLQEQQQVDDNPKDVQEGLQAGYSVVDSQFLPLSEYMNNGDYILIDNKIYNDKGMVLVNMHQVQPETKPHNTEEVKRSEFDDSEKEDSLSETVDEIIKNPSLFSEQSASEVQVINMDQATSEVQVVIACDNYQETEMTDSYLFGIALQSELASSETPSTADIQPTPMDLDETTPDNNLINKSVELSTPKEDAQFCNTSSLPSNDVPQPVSMELLTAVNSITESVGTQTIIENNEEIEQISKDKLTTTYNINLAGNVTNEKSEESEKIRARKVSSEESSQNFFKSQSPTSNLTTQSASNENSSKTFQSSYLKSLNTSSYEQGTSDAKEVNKNSKELETKVYSSRTPDKNVSIKSPFKDQKKYDYQHGIKINPKNTYPEHKSNVSTQKPLKTDPITSQYVSPSANKKPNEPKIHIKQYSPKTYRPKVPPDAFDKLKQDRTDITPPDSRSRYHISSSDPNFIKNRYRKDTPSSDYHRRSFDRNSPRIKYSSQGTSDSRRPQSAYTEPSPKPSYRLPPSDPTHRSSQYNSKKPDTKTSQSRTEQKHSQSASSAHKDWLKNETLLNLIKTANTIYSKKY